MDSRKYQINWHKKDNGIVGTYRGKTITIAKMPRPVGLKKNNDWSARWQVKVGEMTKYGMSQQMAKRAGIELIDALLIAAATVVATAAAVDFVNAAIKRDKGVEVTPDDAFSTRDEWVK